MKRLFVLLIFIAFINTFAQRPLTVGSRLPFIEKSDLNVAEFGSPPSGMIYVYAKDDGRLYTLNSDSTEMLLGAISGANPQDTIVSGVSATVHHNLGYYPTVWFVNSEGVTYTGDNYSIIHNSENEFTVMFGEYVDNINIVYGRGGTSYFSYTVIGLSSFSVEHNLGFYPYVLIRCKDGTIRTANNYNLTHSSVNSFTIDFGETIDTVNVIWR